MTEKGGLAQFLDKVVEGMGKMKENNSQNNSDLANVLPKPTTQTIGEDGTIYWSWITPTDILVQSLLATKENNEEKIAKNEYIVRIFMQCKQDVLTFKDEEAKLIGQAVLSAYNWQNIWKIHAGEFLFEELSNESSNTPSVHVIDNESQDNESQDNG